MSWQLREVPLKFGIGDWTMLSVALPVHVRTLPLTDTAEAIGSPSAPLEPALGKAVGYMMRSLPVNEALPALATQDGYIRYVTLQYTHFYIDLRIGLDAYRAKFSPKTRSTITRKIRRFKDHCGGELKWSTYARVGEVDAFLRLARELSAKTYQERLLHVGIPNDPAFTCEVRSLAARDEFRGYILFDGERPVSYLYCPVRGRTLIYAYLGYDPEYLKLSVGTVLQWLALEQQFGEGRFELFDFTEGQSEHKRLFATHRSPRANVMFVRYSYARLWLLRAHCGMDRLSWHAGRLAQRWGIKSAFRRVLRFGWSSAKWSLTWCMYCLP